MNILEKDLDFWINNNLNVLFVGRHGVGKCLGRGTPVLLYDGRIIPVEYVKSGDLIMGPDSKPRKVLSTCSGIDQMYKIIPNKGDSYICNSVHVLTLKMAGKNEIFDIPLNEFLSKSDTFKKRSMHFRTGVEFENNQTLPEEPYLLGLWLGDGTSSKTQITNSNKQIVDYIYEYADKNELKVKVTNNIEYYLNTGVEFGQKRSGRNKFLSFLKDRDLIKNKHIPHEYLTSSKENRLELLAGIIDTDGSLSNNCFDITQKSHRLSQDILFLARSLGYAAYASPCIKYCMYKNKKRNGKYYRITISGNIDEIPCKIQEKLGKNRLQRKDVLNVGFKVEPVGEGEYFGFTLDGDGRFLLGDFTVTHNTSLVEEAFDRHGLKWKYFSAATMDPWVDFIGIPKEKTDEKGEYLDLIRPKDFADDSVEALFFDEFNRSPKKVRNAVMELIQFKSINGRKFKNLKFVWAAINPKNEKEEYDVEELDPAQVDRFHIHVEVEYKPSFEYFSKVHGKELAESSIEWWNSMSIEFKNLVSPRRLDYCLNIYKMGGNLRHVLPKQINIKDLVKILKNGPVETKIADMIKTKDTKQIREFLADNNNEDLMEEYLTKDPKKFKVQDLMETFTEHISEEKLSQMMTNTDIRNYMVKNMTKCVIFKNVVSNIINSNVNKGLAIKLSKLCESDQNNESVDTTDDRVKWYKKIEKMWSSNDFKELKGGKQASYNMLCDILLRSHPQTIRHNFKNCENIISQIESDNEVGADNRLVEVKRKLKRVKW